MQLPSSQPPILLKAVKVVCQQPKSGKSAAFVTKVRIAANLHRQDMASGVARC
jgi:hypothetical protein